MIRAALIWLCLAVPALADESIVAGLSQNSVSITANFDGSEILIYGAVKRDTPEPAGAPLEVIVTVEGPPVQLKVRRKDRVFGIWINDASVRIDRAPSFYAIATTKPISQILSATEDLRYKVSITRAIRAVGISSEADRAATFVEAMQRIKVANGSYRLQVNAVNLTQSTLFRADVALPANLIEGDYRVRIFLTRGGQVVDEIERRIEVKKEGLEKIIYSLAHEQPLFYAALSLALAVLAGWGASALFRFMRF